MKKLLIASALFLSALTLNATPGTGGYMGHRLIIGGEVAYSPFYTSVKDFFTKYNFQYGGNINVIVGRRSQLGIEVNLWSLGNNQVFGDNYVATDRVKGTEFGLNLRTFRKKRGGLAPIGKFYDVGLNYAKNIFSPGKTNPNQMLSKMASDQIIAHVAFGTQMVFWNRVVANTGIRFGLPIYEVSNATSESFLFQRISYKEYAGVFFGVGILL